ncbi:MAG: hypothetical protein WD490_07790 [Opitutales bacterium]
MTEILKYIRCCLLSATLMAASILNAQPGYWTPDPMESVRPGDAGTFQPVPAPVRLVAPRNGFASGQIVVRGGDLSRVVMSELRGPNASVIPASALRVRFAASEIPEYRWKYPRFDALLDKPPAGKGMQPVWITLHVPAQALPGNYQGVLEIGGARVPVQVRVSSLDMGRRMMPGGPPLKGCAPASAGGDGIPASS